MNIAAQALEVVLGRRQILNGVSLSIPDGAMVGRIGPNGTGKTTLLK